VECVCHVCHLKNACLLWVVCEYFDQGSSLGLLFLRVDCEYNRPFFLATVFQYASAFNGDLNQWDVAKVTYMGGSK
jgi:surface protein